MIPKINSTHGSDTRNIINAAIDSINIQGKSIQDLVAEGQLTPDQYLKLIESVNRLVAKGDISMSDIDLNKGKILQRHLSEEVLSAIAGNAPVNAVPADRSVTLIKTAFASPGKNLFDKERAEIGKSISVGDGYIFNHASYYVSDYIPINPSTDYAFTELSDIVWFDSGKNYLSGSSFKQSLKSPVNANYMRFSGLLSLIDNAQVEVGKSPSGYEPYAMKIDDKYIEKSKVSLLDTSFSSPEKNLFDMAKADTGRTLSVVDGKTVPHVSFFASDFIKIEGNQRYTFSNASQLVWYNKDYVYISGKSAPVTETPPNNAVYLKIGGYLSSIGNAQIEKGDERTHYSPFKLVIDDNVLPRQASAGSSQSSDDYETRKAIAERNALDYIPNAPEKLNIPTYVPSSVTRHTDITHPNVLYFPNGWNGYKFWMCMTPYPMANNKYENPSIVASNDNVTWHEPASNPIAPLESTETFQSDPEILMNGNTMELWYRASKVANGDIDTTFYRKKSTDGVNWTAREAMFNNKKNSQGEIVSPAIIFEDGKYKMWYTRASVTGAHIQEYAESTTGKTWESRVLDIKFDFKDYYFWHGDVYKHDDGKIDMVIGCKSATEPWSVFYTYSYDNINFVEPMLLIKPTVSTNNWDKDDLYKPSLTKVGDELYLYYSTPYNIGLTKGKSLMELGVHEKEDIENMYPVRNLRTKNNAYTINDTFEVFPDNAVIYTKMWSTSDMGWPELSGNLITYCIWKEAGDVKQVFQPKGKNVEHVRTATSNGWTDWVLKS